MDEVQLDYGGRPLCIKTIKGGYGWPFYSFASLPVGLLLAYLLPYMQAPIYQAMRLYIHACLYVSTWSAYCLCLHVLCLYSRRLNSRPCTVMPMVQLLLNVWLMVCYLLAHATTVPGACLVCYLLAYLPNKQAATNRVCCTIAGRVIPLHRRGK